MIGLVMAGGKGIRMNLDNEKLLLKYKKPIILHVIDSLKNSNCFSKILAITSSNSPKTKTLLQENNVEIFDTPGISYVKDLNLALKTINDVVLVTSGDLPLLDKEIIQKIVNQFDSQNIWTSILVTNKFLTTLGIESDYSVNFDNQICHYTGISLVDSKKISSLENLEENYIIIDDKRIAFNLNTKQDYDLLSTT
ncbi:NTP transferase domain-containing protein [Marine Group I thaumarchaeote]|jgi:adenosylcobinamide-phosphate guanylyltransferase|uniref:NTP transferase domain-containing protein n=1 Tax=Marine Group I thaumarchaeote TaxID=2511932 RepID=A0A7K4MH86_9ARCH|nr:MAG: 5-deoxyadenosylcobinamide phosphate nucleotidyltransferase [Nitrosopumilus sp. YT1]NMI82915.1 5-deoxyadenosylcobinamide phosphate nucleotidyltransferase [Candidatus Nitrosopumilus sp. MTA1]NWJ27970.1 NTP transferase domain-containing protein [Marine Group I thaumarchaeote]NWJ56334.1 NTP transferase domain-containing protein [Marine Group I thaumarchaeote]NWJ84571.1 NTP transferase domain-containing protein [Marine Group I thaumarchaeote]